MEVSRETIPKVTDAAAGELDEWQNRPLNRVCAVVLIDAIYVEVRDGAVANKSRSPSAVERSLRFG